MNLHDVAFGAIAYGAGEACTRLALPHLRRLFDAWSAQRRFNALVRQGEADLRALAELAQVPLSLVRGPSSAEVFGAQAFRARTSDPSPRPRPQRHHTSTYPEGTTHDSESSDEAQDSGH